MAYNLTRIGCFARCGLRCIETVATAVRATVQSEALLLPLKRRCASYSRCGHSYKTVPYRRADSMSDPPRRAGELTDEGGIGTVCIRYSRYS
jgi:hypothetical protein